MSAPSSNHPTCFGDIAVRLKFVFFIFFSFIRFIIENLSLLLRPPSRKRYSRLTQLSFQPPSYGSGGELTRFISGDGGADQLCGVPVVERLSMDGNRGSEWRGNGRIWSDAYDPVQGR